MAFGLRDAQATFESLMERVLYVNMNPALLDEVIKSYGYVRDVTAGYCLHTNYNNNKKVLVCVTQ